MDLTRPQKGFYYIATGDKYVKEAISSAESLKSVMPDIPLAIASDYDLPGNLFDYFIKIKKPKYSYLDKIAYVLNSPFEKTIFVDTDILFLQSILDVFELLEKFDICISFSVGKGYWYNKYTSVPECFPEYSTGLIGYKNNSRVTEVFQQWLPAHEQTHSWNPNDLDQPSFRELMWQSNLRIACLPSEYHAIPENFLSLIGSAKLIHSRKAQILAEELNRHTGLRSYMEVLGIIRNLYTLNSIELVKFATRFGTKFPYLLARATFIDLRHQLGKLRSH